MHWNELLDSWAGTGVLATLLHSCRHMPSRTTEGIQLMDVRAKQRPDHADQAALQEGDIVLHHCRQSSWGEMKHEGQKGAIPQLRGMGIPICKVTGGSRAWPDGAQQGSAVLPCMRCREVLMSQASAGSTA